MSDAIGASDVDGQAGDQLVLIACQRNDEKICGVARIKTHGYVTVMVSMELEKGVVGAGWDQRKCEHGGTERLQSVLGDGHRGCDLLVHDARGRGHPKKQVVGDSHKFVKRRNSWWASVSAISARTGATWSWSWTGARSI